MKFLVLPHTDRFRAYGQFVLGGNVMATRKIIKSAPQLERLKAGPKPYDVPIAIAPGMVVRVSVAGRKTFRWDRGYGHKPRIVTYGSFPAITLEKACREHELAKQRHEDGVDLNMGSEVPKTVSELAEVFYKDRIVPQRKRPGDVRRTLDSDILPALGRMKLRSVSTPAVHQMVRKVVERGSPVHAGKVLAHTKQLFRFGVSLGVMDHSPAESLDAINVGAENNRRSRVLNREEIRLFYSALEKPDRLSLTVKVALKVLLLTGLRSGELRLSKWDDVDLDAGTLTVPVANQKLSLKHSKLAKPFVCTLSRQAIEQLRLLEGLDDVWVFPGKLTCEQAKRVKNGELEMQPLTPKVFGAAVRRLLASKDQDGEKLLPVEASFCPHDLRRTLRSGLSALRIAPHIAERCLNHSLGKIIETYDQHDYQDERREALQRWADQVDLYLRDNENVVLLGQQKKSS